MIANIVVSTVPSGRTADDEVRRLAEIEKAAESAYKTSYNITDFSTRFGRTVGLRIRDVAPAGRDAPFPLVRPLMAPKSAVQSLSVHRLFARIPDRFEVAVLELAPESQTENTEAEMSARLSKLADEIVDALQDCTSRMPVRQE